MKKYFLVILVIFLKVSVVAQKGSWIECGLTGDAAFTSISNKNIYNDQKMVTAHFKPMYGAGFKLACNVAQFHEFLINPSFSKKGQSYTIKKDSVTDLEKNLELSTLDLAILYRFHNKDGGFLELGPQFNFFKEIKETTTGGSTDVISLFSPRATSLLFGFGFNIIQANAFTWTAGFRFTWSTGDLLDKNKVQGTNSFPIQDVSIAKPYENYAPTKLIQVGLHTEFNFDLGYFTKSNCKRKKVSFLTF